MTQYSIAPSEVFTIAERVGSYHEVQCRHREYVPTVIKPSLETLEEKWYVTEEPGRPTETKANTHIYESHVTALNESTADVVKYTMNTVIPWADVLVSRKNANYGLQNLSNREILRTMARQEGRFALSGSADPSVNGLVGAAGNISTDSTAWATAPNAHTVVKALADLLITDGFFKPYTLVVSDPLYGDLDTFINSAPVSEINQGHAIQELIGSSRIFPEKQAPSTEDPKVVYPLDAATANDGVILLLKDSPDNFELIIEHPLEMIVEAFDAKRMCFPVTFVSCMTMRVWQANAIGVNTQVDRVA